MEVIFVRLYLAGWVLDKANCVKGGLAVLEKIVVGYSDDEAGHDAMKLCEQIVAALGSEVTVVYPYSPLLSSEPAQAAEEAIRAELRALMPDSEMLAQATYHWSSSSWPIHALHSMASYENAQLIVIGAAREGIAGHLHVGLMERMVHGAPCAVLVAPAGYADGDTGGCGVSAWAIPTRQRARRRWAWAMSSPRSSMAS